MIGEEVSIEGLFVEESSVPDPDIPGEKEATFPCASPMPADGKWAAGTTAYHIRNGAVENAWVSTRYADTDGNLMLDNGVEPQDEEGAWIVCGNDEDGYMFYNLAAGPEYVLGITGSEASARARMYRIGEVPADDVVTCFDYNENGAGYSFRLHGSLYNCFNSRLFRTMECKRCFFIGQWQPFHLLRNRGPECGNRLHYGILYGGACLLRYLWTPCGIARKGNNHIFRA